MELTHDHKLDVPTEVERILAAGAYVQPERELPFYEPARVYRQRDNPLGGPGLTMARSLGDLDADSCGIVATPDVAFHTLCHDMMATMDRGLVPTEAQVAAFEEHAEEALHEGESAQLVEDVRAYLRETMNSA